MTEANLTEWKVGLIMVFFREINMNKCEQFTALQLFSDTEPTGEFMPWKKRPDKDFFSQVKSKGTKEKNKNSLTEGLIVGAMGSISRGVSVKTRDSSRLSPGSPDSDLV